MWLRKEKSCKKEKGKSYLYKGSAFQLRRIAPFGPVREKGR